ncbi:MAG: serine/threonine-protein kinase, partial [Myxococcales bacterium]
MTLQARYTVRRKIADGGTAEIFLAIQRGAHGFEKSVVLKRIFPALYADPQFRNMLIDEAHVAMSLNHSNIVQVLDLGEADGQYVLALELVDGWNLDSVLRRSRALNATISPALALYITAEVCRALAYAHAKVGANDKPIGIVHRDISPHNVLLSEQGEVKLTDFGIAKTHSRRESSIGNIIKGKIAYMAPEQASGGALDSRSDLFSVGTMLYVMVCHRYPFDAPTDLEVLLLVKNGEFEPPENVVPGLNPEIYRVIKRALAKDPDARYQRAEEMLIDVEQVMRTGFRAVGQTELKRWLQDLS